MNRRTAFPAATALAALVLAGCAAPVRSTVVTAAAAPASIAAPVPSPTPQPPATLPGLGPKTLAQIPGGSRQVLIVTGAGPGSDRSSAVLYRLTAAGWQPGPTWAAHNALHGWTTRHRADDLHSPVGVFTLTDAGGRLADPGSKLPYTRSRSGYTLTGTGFSGEPLAGSFDYVIAINYNHVPGTTPLDWTRPLGAAAGGGIWLHVDHGGATHGCVSLPRADMVTLLRTLDPGLHPVVVMGDRARLQR
ncbi:L,D-transpeptidase family protein [Streptacidiphilus sp. PAMC 29251]